MLNTIQSHSNDYVYNAPVQYVFILDVSIVALWSKDVSHWNVTKDMLQDIPSVLLYYHYLRKMWLWMLCVYLCVDISLIRSSLSLLYIIYYYTYIIYILSSRYINTCCVFVPAPKSIACSDHYYNCRFTFISTFSQILSMTLFLHLARSGQAVCT